MLGDKVPTHDLEAPSPGNQALAGSAGTEALSIGTWKAAKGPGPICLFGLCSWLLPIPALKANPNLEVGTLSHIPKVMKKKTLGISSFQYLSHGALLFFSLPPPHSLNC